MTKFTVKEREEGKPCFVCEEESRVYFEIDPAADFEHAREIARFLNRNIREVVVDRQLEDYIMGNPKLQGEQ
jgi:hypothetical protein